MDVKTAFLNDKLEKRVFMEIPEGLKKLLGKKEDFNEHYICELQKSIHGLRVSPKRWFIRFSLAMQKIRFHNYPLNPCLFIWRDLIKFATVLVYVDDLLIITNCNDKLNEIKTK